MSDTYTDDNGSERCDNCEEDIEGCVCVCLDCDAPVWACACYFGPTYEAAGNCWDED